MPNFQSLNEVIAEAKQRQGYWYVATPYAKYDWGHEEAFRDAATVAGRLFDCGVQVFSPIAHSHPLATYGGIDNVDHRKWLDLDQHFMEPAVGMIVVGMDGWDKSKGIAEEIAFFELTRKPILYLEFAGLT